MLINNIKCCTLLHIVLYCDHSNVSRIPGCCAKVKAVALQLCLMLQTPLYPKTLWCYTNIDMIIIIIVVASCVS